MAGHLKRRRGTAGSRRGEGGVAFGRFVVALTWLLLAAVLLVVVHLGRRFYGV